MNIRNHQLQTGTGYRQRGIALMMVVFAIAIATVLGMAILASSSMQTQVKGNILAAAQADCLAESGVNLGIY
jgi:Tfp pilus assembly protein PilX